MMFLLTSLQKLSIDQIFNRLPELQGYCEEILKLTSERYSRVSTVDRLVMWTSRNQQKCILGPMFIREDLIRFYHEPGTKKTLDILRRYFNWLGAKQDVIDFIAECVPCKEGKHRNCTLGGPFKSVVAENPLQVLSVD